LLRWVAATRQHGAAQQQRAHLIFADDDGDDADVATMGADATTRMATDNTTTTTDHHGAGGDGGTLVSGDLRGGRGPKPRRRDSGGDRRCAVCCPRLERSRRRCRDHRGLGDHAQLPAGGAPAVDVECVGTSGIVLHTIDPGGFTSACCVCRRGHAWRWSPSVREPHCAPTPPRAPVTSGGCRATSSVSSPG
jgi:hypothetical protein